MVRFNFCNNIPEAEHCSSKIVDFTILNVVEMVENEQSHSLFPKGGALNFWQPSILVPRHPYKRFMQ